MKLLEMIYRQSIERVVEERFIESVEYLLDTYDVSYEMSHSYYHPEIGTFYIARIWSSGTISPTRELIDKTLNDLRSRQHKCKD